MKETLQLRVDSHTYTPTGSEVWVQTILPEWDGVVLTSTEKHEAVHAVVGEAVHPGCVDELSTQAGDGYLGYVQMSFMTAEAAIAPAMFDMGGTSHDEGLVAQMNVDAGAAGAVAKSIVNARPEEIQSVGFEAHKKKTLNGVEVRHAISRVYDKREAQITKKNPDGSYEVFNAQVIKGVVFMENDLPLAA